VSKSATAFIGHLLGKAQDAGGLGALGENPCRVFLEDKSQGDGFAGTADRRLPGERAQMDNIGERVADLIIALPCQIEWLPGQVIGFDRDTIGIEPVKLDRLAVNANDIGKAALVIEQCIGGDLGAQIGSAGPRVRLIMHKPESGVIGIGDLTAIVADIDLDRERADGRGDQFDGSGNGGNAHGVGGGDGNAAGRMRDAENAEREIGIGERVAFALKEALKTVERRQAKFTNYVM
jgi:hypothetical protein